MQIFFIIHIIISIFLIVLVVLQPPQEDGMIAGSSHAGANSLFSSGNSDNFLNKLTKTFAGLFLFSSLLIAYLSASSGNEGSLLEKLEEPQAQQEQIEEEGLGQEKFNLENLQVPEAE